MADVYFVDWKSVADPDGLPRMGLDWPSFRDPLGNQIADLEEIAAALNALLVQLHSYHNDIAIPHCWHCRDVINSAYQTGRSEGL